MLLCEEPSAAMILLDIKCAVSAASFVWWFDFDMTVEALKRAISIVKGQGKLYISNKIAN